MILAMKLWSRTESSYILLMSIINPRRACAARVTVLGPCVSLSVCLSVSVFVCLSTFVLELQAMRQLMSDMND